MQVTESLVHVICLWHVCIHGLLAFYGFRVSGLIYCKMTVSVEEDMSGFVMPKIRNSIG